MGLHIRSWWTTGSIYQASPVEGLEAPSPIKGKCIASGVPYGLTRALDGAGALDATTYTAMTRKAGVRWTAVIE